MSEARGPPKCAERKVYDTLRSKVRSSIVIRPEFTVIHNLMETTCPGASYTVSPSGSGPWGLGAPQAAASSKRPRADRPPSKPPPLCHVLLTGADSAGSEPMELLEEVSLLLHQSRA